MEYRNLEKVRSIVKDATGLDISYAYDDLVFPDHTAFIIQFDDQTKNGLFCYFQEGCMPNEQQKILTDLMQHCLSYKYILAYKGTFKLEQKGEEVNIHFNKTTG